VNIKRTEWGGVIVTTSVFTAARKLCERSGWSISNLELQKLLYIAHMLHLGRHKAPLVSGHFEAWDYGPVHPKLYHHVKVFGSSPVKDVFHAFPSEIDDSAANDLDETVDRLAGAPPGTLVAITHREGGAWEKHYVPGMRNIAIPDADILQEYMDRISGK